MEVVHFGHPSVDTVKNFLLELRMALARESELVIVERDKNNAFLAERGWLNSDLRRLLRNLAAADYAEGPLLDDRGSDWEWWVFGPRYDGSTLYVKLAIRGLRVKCLSIHVAEYAMPRPFGPPQGGDNSE